MKFLTTNFKWLAILAIVIILVWFFKGCGKSKDKIVEVPVVKTEVRYVTVKGDSVYVPKETEKIVYRDRYLPGQTVTTEVRVPADVDTGKILQDFYRERQYSDTQYTQYGPIMIDDKVSQNRITSRNFSYNLSIPETTVTTTTPQKKRNVIYFNAGLWGNQKSPLYGIETGLGLKIKNDKMYSVNGMITKDDGILYNFRLSIPIKFRK